MRAVDTNVLVRLLARDDAKQLAAAEAFVQTGAWISHLVLMEAVWVLDSVYGVEPEQIGNGVEMLLDHNCMVVQDADVVRAAVAQFREHPGLGFSDCLILEVARAAGHVHLEPSIADSGNCKVLKSCDHIAHPRERGGPNKPLLPTALRAADFCDLDADLASKHPPLVAEYQSCGLTVHQDFRVP